VDEAPRIRPPGDILVVATIIGAQHALLTVAQRARWPGCRLCR